jgi:hypothetical protein
MGGFEPRFEFHFSLAPCPKLCQLLDEYLTNRWGFRAFSCATVRYPAQSFNLTTSVNVDGIIGEAVINQADLIGARHTLPRGGVHLHDEILIAPSSRRFSKVQERNINAAIRGDDMTNTARLRRFCGKHYNLVHSRLRCSKRLSPFRARALQYPHLRSLASLPFTC